MRSSHIESERVTMIDGLIGNDYSLRLCSALHTAGVDVELIAPYNRIVNMPVDYPVMYWTIDRLLRSSIYRAAETIIVHSEYIRNKLAKNFGAECLSETILRAFSSRTRLKAMGNSARKLSETRYSWREIAKKTKELYES